MNNKSEESEPKSEGDVVSEYEKQKLIDDEQWSQFWKKK